MLLRMLDAYATRTRPNLGKGSPTKPAEALIGRY